MCRCLFLDQPCIGGLLKGPYILLSLKYYLWLTAFSRVFLLIFGFLCHNMNIYLIPNAIRRRQNRDFKIYGPWNRPPMQWWSKRVMLRLCHSYFFRNCFNFCHITTLSRRKKICTPWEISPIWEEIEIHTRQQKSSSRNHTYKVAKSQRGELFSSNKHFRPLGSLQISTASNNIYCC